MKNILSVLICLIAGTSFGQTCEIYRDGVGADVSGTTILIPLDAETASPYAIHLQVTNTSGADESWQIKRVKISVPDGWNDGLCWPPMCFVVSGDEYTTPLSSAPIITDGTNQTTNSELAELKPLVIPDNSINGTAIYKYYVQRTDGALVDSVTLEFTYTLGVQKENELESINVFPTMASDHINIELGEFNEDCTIKLCNLSGKEISFVENINGNYTLDVLDKRNGIYFVIIEDKFGNKTTRKVLVNH